jgi:hypothetical protein
MRRVINLPKRFPLDLTINVVGFGIEGTPTVEKSPPNLLFKEKSHVNFQRKTR